MRIWFAVLVLLGGLWFPRADAEAPPPRKVDAASLPWTGASYIGHSPKERLPRIGRNFNGNPARVAGRPVGNVISGGTPFVLFYNFDGHAEEFTASLGVDDETGPDAPPDTLALEVVILVDRRERLRRIISPGKPLLPLKLDLRGNSQLEIQAKAVGRGHGQQLILADPAFLTGNPDALRQTLSAHEIRRKNSETPSLHYPAPPSWPRVRSRRVTVGKYRNGYEFDNGAITLTLLPEFGGRISGFSRSGGENILFRTQAHDPEERAVAGKITDDVGGGYFIRVEPLDYLHPGDPVLLYGAYRIEFPSEGHIVMQSAPSSRFLLSCRYEIRIPPDGARAEVTGELRNLASFARPIGCWSVLRIPADSSLAVTGSPERTGRQEVLPLRDPRGKNGNPPELRYHPAAPARWKLQTGQGDVFRIDYRNGPDRETFPDLHFYAGNRFYELEAHSTLKECLPGQTTVLKTVWSFP